MRNRSSAVSVQRFVTGRRAVWISEIGKGRCLMTFSTPRAVLVDTSHSPHTRLKPVPITDVTLTDEFWAPRRRINREVTLPSQFRHCEETKRLDNFRRAAGQREGDFEGIFFNDSDVYKW